MLIGLCGAAGAGKDSVAEILVREHNFTRYAFADRMREALYRLNPRVADPMLNMYWQLRPLVDIKGWDYAKREFPEVRKLLQTFGTEVGREMFGEDFWVNQVAWQYEALMESTFGDANVVIPDVRFPNEADWITDEEGYVLRVERPGVGPVNGHSSEALDFEVDGTIKNAGTLEDLRGAVAEWVRF